MIFLLAASEAVGVLSVPTFLMTLSGLLTDDQEEEITRLSCLAAGENGSSSEEELKWIGDSLMMICLPLPSPAVAERRRRVDLDVGKLIDLFRRREDDVGRAGGAGLGGPRPGEDGAGDDWDPGRVVQLQQLDWSRHSPLGLPVLGPSLLTFPGFVVITSLTVRLRGESSLHITHIRRPEGGEHWVLFGDHFHVVVQVVQLLKALEGFFLRGFILFRQNWDLSRLEHVAVVGRILDIKLFDRNLVGPHLPLILLEPDMQIICRYLSCAQSHPDLVDHDRQSLVLDVADLLQSRLLQ